MTETWPLVGFAVSFLPHRVLDGDSGVLDTAVPCEVCARHCLRSLGARLVRRAYTPHKNRCDGLEICAERLYAQPRKNTPLPCGAERVLEPKDGLEKKKGKKQKSIPEKKVPIAGGHQRPAFGIQKKMV
nr:hypothetical protein [Pandoravirus aubagnensis]